MSPVLQAALASWSVPSIPTLAIVLTALVYLRGWYLLRCAGFPLIPDWRVWAFLTGLFALWVALASPMDVFNSWLLTAHMVQHMVLMMVAPPLILLGAPLIPLVRGLPVFAAREFAGPFLNWRPAQRLGLMLTQPVFALVAMGIVMLGWHVPAPYELAVRSPGWHQFEHACFLVTSLIFWWPVIEPWPSRAPWPRWAMVPYLIIADLLNTLLSATLVFADRVLYPSYVDAPHVFGLSARDDQVAAGAIMWVVGSVAFLIPAMLVGVQYLSRRSVLPPERLKKRNPIFAGTWRSSMAKLGISSRGADALSFLALFLAAGLGFSAMLALSGPDDDDVVLRARQQVGRLAVSVYAPDTLILGTNDVNVLAQDATGSPILDAKVEVSATPAEKTQSNTRDIIAVDVDSDNRLLRSATIDLPAAGTWLVRVDVRSELQSASVSFPAECVAHQPGFDDWWPHLIIPAFALLLLVAYSRSRRRHEPSLHKRVEHAPVPS